MTALYNAILPFFPPSTKGNEKLVNRDIENYPPHINLDRSQVIQPITVKHIYKSGVYNKCNINNNNNMYTYTQNIYTECTDMCPIYS